MSNARHYDQDKESTLYVGNLHENSTDALVWELMLQAGPIVNVHLPKDRVTQTHQGYGFVEFASEEDADYAAKIMNQIRLWEKPLRVNKASADKRGATGPGGGAAAAEAGSVGAELFVGNLDGMVDEKTLFDTFGRFGQLLAPPKIARDQSNLSKGYGFISYASFDSSDDAIANMHGQYLMNKEVTVQYAYKKDGKGERHGDAAERALAAQAKKHGVEMVVPPMPSALVTPSGAPLAPAAMNGSAAPYPSAPYQPAPYQPAPYQNVSAVPYQSAPYQNGTAPAYAPYGSMPVRPPQPPPTYNYAPYPPQQAQPQAVHYQYGQGPPRPPGFPPQGFGPTPSPPAQNGFAPPPTGYRPYMPGPLQQAPTGAGLPARPPPAMGAYGAPPQFAPPGMPPPGGYRPPQQQQHQGQQR